MNECTPDTLRAQLASWHNLFINTDEFEECVTKCADAWEADIISPRGAQDALLEGYRQQVVELRQRLEARREWRLTT